MRFLVILFLLFASSLRAQDPPIAATKEEKKVLETFRDESYPGFVSGKQPEQTSPADSGTTGTQEQPVQQQTLADDLQSTITWTKTRSRLESRLEDIHMTMISSTKPGEMESAAKTFTDDLDLIRRMAPYQAPAREDEITAVSDRINKQLNFLLRDFQTADLRRMQTTDDMLQRSLTDLEEILALSDTDRGAPEQRPVAIPPDWQPGPFVLPDFADEIAGWRAPRLLSAFEERMKSVDDALGKKRAADQRDLEPILEMGELARALAARMSEVPVSSQVSFRNAAMRLDVISENLYDFVGTQKNAYARRQLRYARGVTATCRDFLAAKALPQ